MDCLSVCVEALDGDAICLAFKDHIAVGLSSDDDNITLLCIKTVCISSFELSKLQEGKGVMKCVYKKIIDFSRFHSSYYGEFIFSWVVITGKNQSFSVGLI